MNATRLLLLALLAILPASPALSAATDWIEVAPGAQLRAISAGAERDGKSLVGIELTLEQGLNTYWRVPGETGVPTMVSVSVSGNSAASDILWPLPERDDSQGFVDYVYRNELVLPILVAVPVDTPFTFDVVMGICSDICVPVHAALELPGDTKPDVANGLRLRQAAADTPVPFTKADPPLNNIMLDPETGVLSMDYDPARVQPDLIFPGFDGNGAVYAMPDVDISLNRVTFTLLVRKGDTSWRDAPLRLSFATPDGPYDIVVPAVGR